MIIVGERINATRKSVKEAIARRDREFIQKEAKAQAEAGADYLDINGGTSPEEELENMLWLCETVREAVSVPLCIDSASPEVIEAVLARAGEGVLINSISMEKGRWERVLPLAVEHGAGVVALCMDDSGIPRSGEARLEVAARIAEEAERAGLSLSRVYIDPLVMALSGDASSGLVTLEVIRGVKERWPEMKTLCGLSNISFGLPRRRLVNRVFLAMLMAAGLDAALLDPLDGEMMATVYAARALLGQDEFCMKYIEAYREGRLG